VSDFLTKQQKRFAVNALRDALDQADYPRQLVIWTALHSVGVIGPTVYADPNQVSA
jgi:hypothetical protein